jgi:hypothetical protein
MGVDTPVRGSSGGRKIIATQQHVKKMGTFREGNSKDQMPREMPSMDSRGKSSRNSQR